MKNIEAWRTTSLKVVEHLTSNSIETLNLYLVGSQTTEYKPESDFDVLVLVSNDLKDQELIAVRQKMDQFLISKSFEMKYHFKLFNKRHFELFGFYDGFRLAKFQKSHVPLFKSDYLTKYEPCLDKMNFINSILIQIVYQFMNSLPSTSIDSYFHILTKWMKINLSYNPTFQIKLDDRTLKYFRENDHLFSFFFETFINNNVIDKKGIASFLTDYYSRIPHELINKSNNYQSLLNAV